MNEFDRRWQSCAASARRATSAEAAVPAGFAGRVWAVWQSQRAAPTTAVWLDLSFRALVVASAALAVCAALDFWTAPLDGSFVPHIEDVVTRMLWML
jgi:hypothetical protein